ncbi:MAG: hypothetical protein K2H40_09185, partial [Lachnospiraceae bacterium]|nr:hypothetical protein [Lachnospiraceae bacterium]
AMQAAFLARNNAKEILGYDLYSKAERDQFILDTVTILFHGTGIFHKTDIFHGTDNEGDAANEK